MPAVEFYEWIKGTKQRVTFLPTEEEFMFAGMWDSWSDGTQTIESCVMLTTSANDIMAPVHDRMPVILRPEECVRWLRVDSSVVELREFLRPVSSEFIKIADDFRPPNSQTSLF